MLGRVGGEACDGTGLVVVFEEDGGPAIRGAADEVLCSGYGSLELRKSPILGCSLEFVGALAYVYYVLFVCQYIEISWVRDYPGLTN